MPPEQEAAVFVFRLVRRGCVGIFLFLVFVLTKGSLRSMNRKRSAHSRDENPKADEPTHEIDGSTSSLSTGACGYVENLWTSERITRGDLGASKFSVKKSCAL